MSLSQHETRQLLTGRVEAYRSVHRPHQQGRGPRVVCAFCVTAWPCRQELWVRAVTGETC